MAAVLTGMLHAGMRGAVDREESAAAVMAVTESVIMTATATMTESVSATATATEMNPGLSRDLMQDRSAAGKTADARTEMTDHPKNMHK